MVRTLLLLIVLKAAVMHNKQNQGLLGLRVELSSALVVASTPPGEERKAQLQANLSTSPSFPAYAKHKLYGIGQVSLLISLCKQS